MTNARQYLKPLIWDALLLIILLVITRTYANNMPNLTEQHIEPNFPKTWPEDATKIKVGLEPLTYHTVIETDIDGDGDVDILGTALLDGSITWWENTVGDGSSWTEHRASHIESKVISKEQ